MTYPTHIVFTLAMLSDFQDGIRREFDLLWAAQHSHLSQLVLNLALAGVSPATTFEFETRLAELLRELGRLAMERVCNRIEGDDPAALPSHVREDGEDFRRLGDKTPNRHVATLFGTITLWRHSYRCSRRDAGETAIFPLERRLGLVRGATPALAEAASRYLAGAGATQRSVLDRLDTQHAVKWGAERLRAVSAEMAGEMAGARHECQVERLLEYLREADDSLGSRKPVLSVGRDGITLRDHETSSFEHATAGTVSVHDRAGKRLGTVCLGFAPEPGQPAMTKHMTALIEEVLNRWDGPLPRLCYVTDAGANETAYWRRVLKPMRHPRTGAKLEWHRVIDYYHAAQRIWTMASALFGRDERGAVAWARRMCKLLKKKNGPFRVLHAAARLRGKRALPEWREKEYRKAYNYIRGRTKFMRYDEYARNHLPMGSGVTEAACKTIFTQRLKLSGMRWTKAGAQVILDLRVMLLSNIWQTAHQKILAARDHWKLTTPDYFANQPLPNAA